MAFNIIAETKKKLNYDKIHQVIYSNNLTFDFVPMPGLGINGGDAIGICIPLHNIKEITWAQLKPMLKTLKSKFGCDVYELYGGQKLAASNIESFAQNLFSK